MKLIVNLTPTGMVPTREVTPHVPITPAEIVQDISGCREAGLTSVHVHAREPDGEPTHRKQAYGEVIEGLRSAWPDLVICVSCSGRKVRDVDRRAEVLELDGDLKPDMASLTLSSLNFPRSASVNAPDTVKELAVRMRDRGIRPELEVFDLGMINYAVYLAERGYLEPPFYFNLILGGIASAQARLAEIGLMINALPEGSIWSLGGIGNAQLIANATAITYGGGVRVGIEDNIWLDGERSRLATNRELLERVVELGKLHGRDVMPPAELRDLLQLDSSASEEHR